MEQSTYAAPSKGQLRAGRIISAIPIIFLLLDGVFKFIRPRQVVETTVQLGYSASVIPILAFLVLASTVLYAIPQTAVLGAILLTGYLGGAVATHLRIADPLFSHILAPVYVGGFVWVGLYLRDMRLRSIFLCADEPARSG